MDELRPVQFHQTDRNHQLGRHLEERAAPIQMTHAATSTAGLSHLRQAEQTAGAIFTPNAHSGLAEPLKPAKAKRGRKPGKRSAVVAASSSAGAATASWPMQDIEQPPNDPYEFQCNSMIAQSYNHNVASSLPEYSGRQGGQNVKHEHLFVSARNRGGQLEGEEFYAEENYNRRRIALSNCPGQTKPNVNGQLTNEPRLSKFERPDYQLAEEEQQQHQVKQRRRKQANYPTGGRKRNCPSSGQHQQSQLPFQQVSTAEEQQPVGQPNMMIRPHQPHQHQVNPAAGAPMQMQQQPPHLIEQQQYFASPIEQQQQHEQQYLPPNGEQAIYHHHQAASNQPASRFGQVTPAGRQPELSGAGGYSSAASQQYTAEPQQQVPPHHHHHQQQQHHLHHHHHQQQQQQQHQVVQPQHLNNHHLNQQQQQQQQQQLPYQPSGGFEQANNAGQQYIGQLHQPTMGQRGGQVTNVRQPQQQQQPNMQASQRILTPYSSQHHHQQQLPQHQLQASTTAPVRAAGRVAAGHQQQQQPQQYNMKPMRESASSQSQAANLPNQQLHQQQQLAMNNHQAQMSHQMHPNQQQQQQLISPPNNHPAYHHLSAPQQLGSNGYEAMEQQYAAGNSPTLLQQQLNRHPHDRPTPAPVAAPPVAAPPPHLAQHQQHHHHHHQQQHHNQQQQQQPPPGSLKRRYEGEVLIEHYDNEAMMANSRQQSFHPHPSRQAIAQRPSNQLHQRHLSGPSAAPKLDHPSNQQLLGNPTPPLTPTASLHQHQHLPPAALQRTSSLAPNVVIQHPAGCSIQPNGVSAPPTTSATASSTGLADSSHQIHWQQPPNDHHHLAQAAPASAGYNKQAQLSEQPPRIMPKNVANFQPQAQHYHQQHYLHNNHPNNHTNNHQQHPAPPISQQVVHQPQPLPSSASVSASSSQARATMAANQLQQQQHQSAPVVSNDRLSARLTLPLRDAPILGPFKLDHEAQFTSKVFHLKAQLFETLSKSAATNSPNATVVQELQFRAYLSGKANESNCVAGNSLLASNNNNNNQDSLIRQQQQTAAFGSSCQWPDKFQMSINQNLIQLDRSNPRFHRALDVFQFCQMGDNLLEMQVNDCYCSHEFLLEAVDRPTLRAFINSCFKSRLLTVDLCLQKLKFNFGSAGFLIHQKDQQQQQQQHYVTNDYVTEMVQGIEQTRACISLKCPISGRRMETPTRGHNCKHLQCFDLESFLFSNRERSQWNCPICPLAIPFNMLELDQHQIQIVQAMSEVLNTNEVLIDSNGQWQANYASPSIIAQHQHQAAAPIPMATPTAQQAAYPNNQLAINNHQQVAESSPKSNGTYHPQQVMSVQAGELIHQQQQQPPMRPMSGPSVPGRYQPTPSSPAVVWEQPMQRSASAMVIAPGGGAQQAGRRSANGSPPNKKPYGGQFAGSATSSLSAGAPASSSGYNQAQANSGGEMSDELSPLAAMERTIIQHEQQMGPPPFDPNSLTSSPLRSASAACNQANAVQSSTSLISAGQPSMANQQQVLAQVSPDSRNQFSPAAAHLSPAGRPVPASPQQQQQQPPQRALPPSDLPQSPSVSQQLPTASTSISTPATPLSTSLLAHGGPETPATPGNSQQQQHQQQQQQHQQQQQQQQHCNSTSAGLTSQQSSGSIASVVDHQPLSNGSASAGSITSSSAVMTPSGQSLGSVGMGGDSRCGTAPLPGTGSLALDDLMLPGGSGASGLNSMGSAAASNSAQHFKQSLLSSPHVDERSEILMNKLMLDSSDSLLRDHRNGSASGNSELAMALEEADWRQQLDQGKSEHLANFLNEPLMKKHHHTHHLHHNQQQHQQQLQKQHQTQQQQHQHHHHHHHHGDASNRMLSGGLNPSDDDEEANQSAHSSSPDQHLEQLESFPNYLDADAADNGAGLPPDDSILDLFER